jgi:hypothetical protein
MTDSGKPVYKTQEFHGAPKTKGHVFLFQLIVQ